MTQASNLHQGRAAFDRRAWGDTFARLSAADAAAELAIEDLERLAIAAELIGKDADSADIWARAHSECLRLGDPGSAYAAFDEAARIAERFSDADLMTLGLLGRGTALIQLDQTVAGVALLDEVMVAVTAGEVAPLVVGISNCAVIYACLAIFDLPRAQEWTAALDLWCASQPRCTPASTGTLLS